MLTSYLITEGSPGAPSVLLPVHVLLDHAQYINLDGAHKCVQHDRTMVCRFAATSAAAHQCAGPARLLPDI